jgi:hypothetical protein
MVNHIVAYDTTKMWARSKTKSNAPVTIYDPIAFGQCIFRIVPEMDGMFGDTAAWAADISEYTVANDPVPRPMAIDSSDVVLRTNAGRILKHTVVYYPAVTEFSSAC